ncbi:MAG TPA: hypothetical protein VL123_05485 [Candidatus Udaeobacter sp.]|nr:hypothetical protein [Candidatus Udaeobacter sp.]
MGYRNVGSSVMTGLVLASLVAPMAHADSGPWIRYKQGGGGPVETRRYYGNNHGGSGVGPAIGGLIAGLVIGSQLHAQPVRERVVYAQPVPERVYVARPACPEPTYYEDTNFYDPYNDGWYGSLDQCYDSASRYSEGPRFVVEIDARTGECVNTYNWTGGGWRAGGGDSYWNGCSQRTSDRYRIGRGYVRGGYGGGNGHGNWNNGGWDQRTYNNRYGNGRNGDQHDNRGGRGHGRWSNDQGRDDN